MTRRPDQRKDTSKYFLKFTLTAIILGGMTLFLVLVVLPGRYLLSAGLQESGVNFPSETAPFNPPAGQHIEAPPPPPPCPPSQGPIRGAAEVLWEQVGPLLEAGRYAQALSLFEAYLLSYPGDRGVHREYATTLSRAGRAAEAIQAYQRLLAQKDDPGIRLLLARSLRDRGRVAEASTHYSILAAGDPSDAALSLEWGRALSWNKRFYEATEVLAAAFSRNPGSTQLAIELAQVYYWSGRLGDADRVLAELDAATLDSAGAAQLRNDVSAALARPEPEEDPGEEEPLEEDLPEETPDATPPSFLDLAATALSNEDFEGAAELFKAALKEAPEDSATWRRYADLLQYQLEDLEGAREALRRMEELGAESMAVRFRLAQLSLWTGRNEEAKLRLQRLADAIESDPVPIQTDGFTGLGTREAARRDCESWRPRQHPISRRSRAQDWEPTPSPSRTPTTSLGWIWVSREPRSGETGFGTCARAPDGFREWVWTGPLARSRGFSWSWSRLGGGVGAPFDPASIWVWTSSALTRRL
jgi:Flp pilus assembly protein TadD